MALKIYIAYGTASDQVTALRLQALGAVNGLVVYVPPASTRHDAHGDLDPYSRQQFLDCDVVLGVVTTAPSQACRQELALGSQMKKRTIVLAAMAQASTLEAYFPGRVVLFDPADPTRAEQHIVRILRESDLQADAAKALLALGTIALGLLIFAPSE